jgi:hypothetical protein
MDLNIACLVILNATLVQQNSNCIGNWLPVVTSFIVVILGASITYILNNKLERNKRRYELKRDTYFELLDTLLKLQRVFIDAQRILRSKEDKTDDSDHTVKSSEEIVLEKAFSEAYDKLKLLKVKIQLFDDSKIIEEIINNYLGEWIGLEPPKIDDTLRRLIKALNEEL